MYFEDAATLETHINNDWSVFLKNLKQREDLHYELLIYNKKILSRQRNQDDELFVKDQILQHQQQYLKITNLSHAMHAEEQPLMDKYQTNIATFEQIVKMMSRVGARILETCQGSLDKCKAMDQELIDRHHKMKVALIKEISFRDRVNLEEVTKIAIVYTKTKLNNQLDKLSKLIQGLQNGQYERLNQIYTPKARKLSVVVEKQKVSLDKAKVLSVGRDEKSPLRDEVKKIEKIRKQKQKLAAKLVLGTYSMMDLSRNQLMEDMCCFGKQKITKLYNQIFSRNKFNHQQIIAFQAKKDEFHQKVRIFKEMMQRQSSKISQVFIGKAIKKDKQNNELSHSVIVNVKGSQKIEDIEELELNQKKGSNNRYRISSPKGKRESKDLMTSYNVFQSTQQNFNHFKFDASGQEVYARTNRNRLPQIYNIGIGSAVRGSSLDQRNDAHNGSLLEKTERQVKIQNIQEFIKLEKSKEVKFREERHNIQRTRMVMKNVEVGVEGVQKREQPLSYGKDKRKIEPNPMEYTFYVRKSKQKFYQPKHNIII